MTAYDSLVEEVVRLSLEVPHIEFFIINVYDAVELGLKPIMDDADGSYYFDVEGFRIKPSLDCPEGVIGACVQESTQINVGFVGSC